MTQGASPMGDKVPTEMKNKIMNATLEMPGGATLMGADHPQGKNVQPTGFCVSVQVNDISEGERIFKALAEGGKLQMAFQKTFWSPGFGMCTDMFGIPWMVNCAAAAWEEGMSFQAYIDNIKAKTGKKPEDFKKLAERKGLLKPGIKAMEIVGWLKKDHGLGHGHAMAIYATFKGMKEYK
jgi:PhnB protein